MTPAQAKLLRKCILFMRSAETPREELVEVGWIAGVNPRTAQTLVEAGVLVYDMPSTADECTSPHVRLPRKDEIEMSTL